MDELIIYGAGGKGHVYMRMLKDCGLGDRIVMFCDERASELSNSLDYPVVAYEIAKKTGHPFLLAVRKEHKEEIKSKMITDGQKFYENLDEIIVDEMGLMTRVDYERYICSIAHIDSMDSYFDNADTESALNRFWGEGIFRKLFNQLDLTNVVELACGRGRHVPQYINMAGHVTLVDVLDKNIEICKERFAGESKLSYVVNNGKDLSALLDDEFTSLFTYDSMVHFELMDVASYLNETYRILKPGGMALFHHSNNDSDYKASYDNAVEARSYMNKDLFAYLAYRAGFEIIEQHIIDWVVPNLDCVSLVKKPFRKEKI
ncbi:methyltransferase domain-containing protein [Pseudobutyrivibrio sp.]